MTQDYVRKARAALAKARGAGVGTASPAAYELNERNEIRGDLFWCPAPDCIQIVTKLRSCPIHGVADEVRP